MGVLCSCTNRKGRTDFGNFVFGIRQVAVFILVFCGFQILATYSLQKDYLSFLNLRNKPQISAADLLTSGHF
jgi:hypothetical protein